MIYLQILCKHIKKSHTGLLPFMLTLHSYFREKAPKSVFLLKKARKYRKYITNNKSKLYLYKNKKFLVSSLFWSAIYQSTCFKILIFFDQLSGFTIINRVRINFSASLYLTTSFYSKIEQKDFWNLREKLFKAIKMPFDRDLRLIFCFDSQLDYLFVGD